MRAAVLTAPRSLRVEAVAVPVPQAGEVRVRLEGCGVCASNLPTWTGMPWTQYPTEPGALGHEGWGIIDAVGDEVTGLTAGDRAAAGSYRASAGYDLAPSRAVVKLPPDLHATPFPGAALAR